MDTRPRLALLMLTVLLGVIGPPNRPPGFKPPISARMISCPNSNCRGMGIWKSGYRYSCNEHNHTFYYCYKCKHYYPTKDKAVEHRCEAS